MISLLILAKKILKFPKKLSDLYHSVCKLKNIIDATGMMLKISYLINKYKVKIPILIIKKYKMEV